jgi:hypothetical protein
MGDMGDMGDMGEGEGERMDDMLLGATVGGNATNSATASYGDPGADDDDDGAGAGAGGGGGAGGGVQVVAAAADDSLP